MVFVFRSWLFVAMICSLLFVVRRCVLSVVVCCLGLLLFVVFCCLLLVCFVVRRCLSLFAIGCALFVCRCRCCFMFVACCVWLVACVLWFVASFFFFLRKTCGCVRLSMFVGVSFFVWYWLLCDVMLFVVVFVFDDASVSVACSIVSFIVFFFFVVVRCVLFFCWRLFDVCCC